MPPAGLTDRARTAILVVACVAQFVLIVDDTIVNVALPTIGRDLGFTESQLSWVANAYLLTFGGFLLVGGRLADRVGRRRAFAGALAAFAISSALCGLASSPEMLVAARGAQGLAGALLSPAALSILLATFPAQPGRGRALSAWASLLGLGAVTGLLAGGVIVEFLDWRWIFLLNLPVAAAALVAVPRLVPPDVPQDHRPRPSVGSAVLGTAALLLFVFTVVETDGEGWTSARTLGGLGVALALGALFALAERGADSPLLPRVLLRRRRAMSANLVVFLAAGGLLAMFFFLSLYMQRVLEWSPLTTGAAFLPFSVAMGALSAAAERISGRVDARVAVAAGLLVAAGGLAVLSDLGPDSAYLTHLAPGLVLVAAGLGLALVPVMGIATGGADERDGGLASAMLTTAQQVGGAVGIAVLVTVATHATSADLRAAVPPPEALTSGFTTAFRVQVGVMLAAALLAVVLLRPDAGEDAPAPDARDLDSPDAPVDGSQERIPARA